MKKKSRLILPIALPFLTGCLVNDNYGDYGPAFSICELDDANDEVCFVRSDGVTLSIAFGFYNKDFEKPTSVDFNKTFMFLVGDGFDAKEFECAHLIEEPYEETYYTTGSEKYLFRKKAQIYLGSDRFDSEKGHILLVLAYTTGSEPRNNYLSDEFYRCAEIDCSFETHGTDTVIWNNNLR